MRAVPFKVSLTAGAGIAPGGGRTPIERGPCGLTASQQEALPDGRYKLLRGGAWPSVLNLPQMPFKALPVVAEGPMTSAWTENKRQLEPSRFTLPMDWHAGRP